MITSSKASGFMICQYDMPAISDPFHGIAKSFALRLSNAYIWLAGIVSRKTVVGANACSGEGLVGTRQPD
jgi:hypothetical protein